MKETRIPLEKRRNTIIKSIMQSVIKSSDKNHAKKILDLWFADKPKQEKPNAEWVNDFVIGEEVLVDVETYRTLNIKGIINKINKKSVTVRLFDYDVISDYNALSNQTYGADILIWSNITNKTKVIFDRRSITKKGQSSYKDAEFIRGKRSVDYGN